MGRRDTCSNLVRVRVECGGSNERQDGSHNYPPQSMSVSEVPTGGTGSKVFLGIGADRTE